MNSWSYARFTAELELGSDADIDPHEHATVRHLSWLNSLGSEGWEAIETRHAWFRRGAGYGVRCSGLFKRAIPMRDPLARK